MTQHTEHAASPTDTTGARQGAGASPPPRPWWRRPWIIPLALINIGFIVYNLTPFRELDPATAPMPPHDGFPAYYPLLLAHMAFGTIAMVTVVLQLWPHLRRTRPRVHRVSGRLYVVAAIISGVIGLVIVRFAPPIGQIGVSAATLVWIFTTTMGFIRARQGRYAQHRRWMLYSFAVVMNNVWGNIIVRGGLALPEPIDVTYLLEAARWIGWVLNLALVQWWIYHTDRRPEVQPV